MVRRRIARRLAGFRGRRKRRCIFFAHRRHGMDDRQGRHRAGSAFGGNDRAQRPRSSPPVSRPDGRSRYSVIPANAGIQRRASKTLGSRFRGNDDISNLGVTHAMLNKIFEGMTMSDQLDQLCIDTVRFLSVDAVQKAKSGHPGMPLGAAPMAYVLWTRLLKHNPRNPEWFDRDRFVLSAGHGSMLLYSLLYLTGYDLTLDDIKQFRQFGSKAPGHPERGHTPGVETTTGPLGQGFANAVGMAIAEAQLAARYNRPGFDVIDHASYAIVSDGDLMEGVGSEAASLAGHLRLGKLTCRYDDNYVTLPAGTDLTSSEDRARRFEAYGWHTVSVPDGNDLGAIDAALCAALAETARPSLILVRTHIGYGSPNKHDSFEAHGSPLGVEEVRLTKQNLGWPSEPPFLIPEEALSHFREAVTRGERDEAASSERMAAYAQAFPDLAGELQRTVRGELPPE